MDEIAQKLEHYLYSISERIITLQLNFAKNQMSTVMSACYTNSSGLWGDKKRVLLIFECCNQRNPKKTHKVILLGNMNARVSRYHDVWTDEIGKEGVDTTWTRMDSFFSQFAPNMGYPSPTHFSTWRIDIWLLGITLWWVLDWSSAHQIHSLSTAKTQVKESEQNPITISI